MTNLIYFRRILFLYCFFILSSCTDYSKSPSHIEDTSSEHKVKIKQDSVKRPIFFILSKRKKSLRPSLQRTLNILDANQLKFSKDSIRNYLLKKLSSQWIQVEKKDTSFIEYKPCNGQTPVISFQLDTVIINFTHEAVGFIIGDVIKVSKFKYKVALYTSTRKKELKKIELFITKRKSDDIGIFEWKIFSTQFQWVMTNDRLKYPFLFTKCDSLIVAELKLDQIEIDSLKQKICLPR